MEIDFEAYQLGYEDCKGSDNDMSQYDNPYDPETGEYYSYRRGWNSYWNPQWKDK